MAHDNDLNFARSTEDAFNFYKSVFGYSFITPATAMFRFPEAPQGQARDMNRIINVALPILGGTSRWARHAPQLTGFKVSQGDNFHTAYTRTPGCSPKAHVVRPALSAAGSGNNPARTIWLTTLGTSAHKFRRPMG